ncbi:MAG: amino acid ABC transporter permease [Clostridiales bacterium]|nr:amino acid ABC transporter permease [Clostridiales bacterium]
MSIFTSYSEKTHPFKATFNLVLMSLLITALFWLALSLVGVRLNFSFLAPLSGRIFDGYLMTVCLSAASFFISLLLGVACAAMQSGKILVLRYFAKLYVIAIRGTPLIMQVYLFFYLMGTAYGITNRFICGVLILSLFEGAYIAEIVRGSLLSMDGTQLEAAKAVGFTKKQQLALVVLPQLLARTLPALTGQFASMIKDSSLLCMIALIELTQTLREISAMNFKMFECYMLLGVLYLSLTLPITYASKRLEQRFDYEA